MKMKKAYNTPEITVIMVEEDRLLASSPTLSNGEANEGHAKQGGLEELENFDFDFLNN